MRTIKEISAADWTRTSLGLSRVTKGDVDGRSGRGVDLILLFVGTFGDTPQVQDEEDREEVLP